MTEQKHEASAPAPDAERVSEARRRLLRGGIAGAPVVVLTLASRPVLATSQTVICQSMSRTMSGNLSQPNTQLQTCNGRKITYYKSSGNCPIKTTTTAFSTIFARGSYSGSNFGTKSINDVLNQSNPTQTQRIAQCFVTALFNIRAGLVSPKAMTENDLRNIWNEYANKNGTYQPFAGGPLWRASDMLSYFDSTAIVPDALG
ncbi:MAG: hypothetical protein QM803_09130 [Rhodocyclaceae bacterium]